MSERIFTRDDAKSIIRTNSDKIKLPSDFTVIGRGALAGFSQVKDLTIPEGIHRISSYAFFIRSFKGTSSMEKLTIPSSLKEFDRWCFFDCNALKAVTLPEDFPEKEAMELFFHCPEATLNFGKKLLFAAKSKTVKQVMDETPGILSLGSASLLQPENNGDLIIPQSYCYIPPRAMNNLATRGIKRIIFHKDMKIISANVFAMMNTLEAVVFADGTEYIDNYAFSGCKSLRSVTIPDSVTKIGAGAFMNCKSLEEIRLPKNLECIEDEVFSGCSSLKRIIFGDKIVSVGAGAFNECGALQQVILPESVRSVGISAFWNCGALQRLYIPSGTESLAQSSLCNCPMLSELYMPHIVHDKLEQHRIFGDNTNPVINWIEPGMTAPDWGDGSDLEVPDLSAGFAGVPQVPETLPVSEPALAPVSGLTVHEQYTDHARPQQSSAAAADASAVDAQTVQQMQQTIAAMQAQLSALSKSQPENLNAAASPAPAVDAQTIEQINRNLAAVQEKVDAVSSSQPSAETLSGIAEQLSSISGIQSRVEEIAARQESVQEQVDAITGTGNLSGMQDQAAAISGLQEKLEAISDIQEKVEAISGIQEKVDAISDVQQKVSMIPELQQRVEEISEMQNQLGAISSMPSAETISELQEAAGAISQMQEKVEAISEIQEKVDAISEIQEKVDKISAVEEQIRVLPELQQKVEAIAEAQAASDAAADSAPAEIPSSDDAVQPGIPQSETLADTPSEPVPVYGSFDSIIMLSPVRHSEKNADATVFTHEISKPMPGPKERSTALKDYTVIAYRAFRNAEGGERFEIPEGIRRVESQAFWDSPRLMALELPLSLTEIEPDAFSGCSRITDIYVKEGYSERLIAEAFLFRPDAIVHWPKKGLLSKPRTATVAELAEQFDDILTEHKAKKLQVRSHFLTLPEGYTVIAPGALQHIDPRKDEPEHVLKTVILPKSIRRIAARAFSGLENAMHVVIPDGLQIVDMNAFTSCVGPYRLVLPDSVSYIGPYAFSAPCQFEQIRLPGTLRSLCENVMTNCNTLISLRIPESVTEIGEAALSGCTALASLTVPKRFEEDLKLILDGPVKINVNWTEEESEEFRNQPNPEFLSVVEPDFDPVSPQRLFTYELSVSCTTYADRLALLRSHPIIGENALADMANQTKFEIPLGVLRLCSYAFGSNTRLLTLTVPKALTEFEYAAFYGCTRLRDVFLPEEFDRGCAAVLFMRKPQILLTFGTARSVRVRQLMAECPWILSPGDAADLTVEQDTLEIPEGYLVIASFMYHGITGFADMKRIIVPSSARLIGSNAFVSLEETEEIICRNGLRAVEPNAIMDCPELRRIVLPPTLKFLGVHAFSECPKLESLVLPKNFSDRAAEILRDCPRVHIEWIDELHAPAAAPVDEITLEPAGEPVTEEIPEPIENLADTLFTGTEPAAPAADDILEPADDLIVEPAGEPVTEEIPEEMRSLADALFGSTDSDAAADSLENADLDDLNTLEPLDSDTVPENPAEDSFETADLSELSQLDAEPEPEAIPELTIPEPAAEPEPEAIPELTIPEPAAEPEPEAIPELTIPEPVEEPAIGTEAEAAAELLSEIEPEPEIESLIEEPAIGTGSVAVSILLDELRPSDSEEPEPETDENDPAAIYRKMELADALGIKLDDEDIVQIMTEEPPEWAVHSEHLAPRGDQEELPGLPEISIPEEAGEDPEILPIPKNGRFTAKECRARYRGEMVYQIPSGFTDIRSGACAALETLEKVVIPDTVTNIGNGAFADCTALNEVYIPRSVKTIAEDAFDCCDALTQVTMPRELEALATDLFGPQTKITWIEPEKPAMIGDGRFTAKIRAKIYDEGDTLEIPEGYLEIRAGACAGLEDLESVVLPQTLTKICSGAFADCTALKTLVIPSGVTVLEDEAFEGCTALTQVSVPKSIEEAARASFPSDILTVRDL